LLSGAIAVLVTLSAVAAPPQPAQLVLLDGHIHTQNPSQPRVEALAIRDGKIVAAGTNEHVAPYRGPRTRVIDLHDRFAMPGINDVHVHVQAAGNDLALYNCPFSQYSSFEQVIAAVRGCAEKVKAGEWIIGTYWNSSLYGRLEKADALRALDAASAGHPVILRNDTIHDRWVNSRALSLAGITRDTRNPPNGVIGHDPATGELNGLLKEFPAVALVEKVSPLGVPASPDEQLQRLTSGLQALTSMGVTGFQDAAVAPAQAELFAAADRAGHLRARASLCLLVDPNAPGNLGKLFTDASRLRTERLRPDCAKIFLDGVMVSRTGVFLEPYLPDKEHGANFRGEPKTTQEKLNALVIELDRRAVSVKMHAAGDGSVRQAIDAVEAARKANGPAGPMHTIAHAGFIADSDVPRLKALRIAADASPTVWYPGPILDATVAVLGSERAYRFWPAKTMMASGVVLAGGTDWKSLPDEFSDLWSGIEGLVTRRNPTGKMDGVLAADQAVDVATALSVYTANAAKAIRVGEVTGTLEVGKSAELIVLDRDPFKIAPEDISDTKVLMTFFEGQLVYERK
jgi:predicted amidohydrolase YtcJ